MVILARKLNRKVSHRGILFSDKVKKNSGTNTCLGSLVTLKKQLAFPVSRGTLPVAFYKGIIITRQPK
jgi:hypothetical protein